MVLLVLILGILGPVCLHVYANYWSEAENWSESPHYYHYHLTIELIHR